MGSCHFQVHGVFQAKQTAGAKALWPMFGAHDYDRRDEGTNCGPPHLDHSILTDEETEDRRGHTTDLRLPSYLVAKQGWEEASQN